MRIFPSLYYTTYWFAGDNTYIFEWEIIPVANLSGGILISFDKSEMKRLTNVVHGNIRSTAWKSLSWNGQKTSVKTNAYISKRNRTKQTRYSNKNPYHLQLLGSQFVLPLFFSRSSSWNTRERKGLFRYVRLDWLVQWRRIWRSRKWFLHCLLS